MTCRSFRIKEFSKSNFYWSQHKLQNDRSRGNHAEVSQHKKWSFLSRVSSVNVTKFGFGFGHIYWINVDGKLQFLRSVFCKKSALKTFRKIHRKIPVLESLSLHKKWSFPLRIFSVNVSKFTVSCRFGHFYWKNP